MLQEWWSFPRSQCVQLPEHSWNKQKLKYSSGNDNKVLKRKKKKIYREKRIIRERERKMVSTRVVAKIFIPSFFKSVRNIAKFPVYSKTDLHTFVTLVNLLDQNGGTVLVVFSLFYSCLHSALSVASSHLPSTGLNRYMSHRLVVCIFAYYLLCIIFFCSFFVPFKSHSCIVMIIDPLFIINLIEIYENSWL